VIDPVLRSGAPALESVAVPFAAGRGPLDLVRETRVAIGWAVPLGTAFSAHGASLLLAAGASASDLPIAGTSYFDAGIRSIVPEESSSRPWIFHEVLSPAEVEDLLPSLPTREGRRRPAPP
jgi:hypothetical protein